MLNFVEDEPWVVNSSTDEIGRCVHLDGNWTTLTGQSLSEALGHGWLNVLYPDDRVPTIERLSKALKKRIGFRHEFRIRRQDGAYRWALAVGAPRVDQTGFLGYAGSIVDIHESRLAREAVQDREEKLRLALDAAKMGTFVWHLNDNRWERDARMLELFGLSAEGPLSLNPALQQDIHPDDRLRFADAVARACDPDAGGRLEEDVRIQWPDGTSRWLQVSAQVHFTGEPRRPLRMVGAAVDITEREQAKEALRISRERQAFLLRLSDAIRPIADPAGIQREAATLLGQRLQASRVHYGEVSADGAWATVREDYCNKVATVVGKHHLDSYGPLLVAEFRAGRTLAVDDVGTEDRLSPQERLATQALDIGAYAIAPLLKGGRLVALFVVHFHDPHRWSKPELSLIEEVGERTWAAVERALAEERLAVAHERLTATLRASPVAAFEQDRDLRYVWIQNPALGYRAEDAVGKTDLELFEREEDARALITVKQRALDTGAQAREEVRVLSAGVMRWYDLIVEPRRSGETIVGLLCTATDITEHKQTEAALTEANRRKREFLAVLGHELRNPLASIEHGVQLLASTEKDADRQRTNAAIALMARQAEHLDRLADDLLDISRIDQDKIEIRREHVDVALALRDAVEAVRPQIEEKGQQFEASVPPEPVMVVGDRTRIAQIIANLVGNAIKYTGPDGVIRVDLESQNRNAVLTVRDSGVGIAPEVLPRVFDLFMQADRTDQRGLGIGLALSKKLVELHGGAIEAHSAGLGKGSAFVVRLPLDQASAETAVTTSASSARVETSVRVLVIDDNRDVADSLAMLLKTFDLAVKAVYDGESGVEAARTFQPDLAFIDIRMPKIDGYETARRIRALPADRKPTLVALSGLGQDKDHALSEAGFDLQLVKPVRPDAIAALIGRQGRLIRAL